MGKYILRRSIIAIPTLIAISFVVFAILALAPTDPLAQFAADPRVPPEVRERIRDSLGLNDPWPLRYVKWVTSLAQGNFGVSFMSHSSVSDLILQRLPNTLAVVGVAYVLGLLIGIPAGMLSAIKRYSSFDYAATFLAFVGFSLPTFFVGLTLIIIFSIQLHWLPFIYDSTLRVTSLASLGDQLRQSIMPITVLSLANAALIVRYTRNEMVEQLPLDYVRTARSKGLRESVVVSAHVLRNSLIPVVTLVALGIPTIFGGAIVTEQIFRVPGVGELLVTAIGNGDTPVVTAVLFIFAVLVVLFNLIADVAYTVLDPRLRLA
ncbi:MAG TPA: ABC transporter permease [Candidatus Limnocylindria bacterium]